MVEMQAKIEEERKALETKLDMEEEERNKARAELEKREKDLLKAQWVPCSSSLCGRVGFSFLNLQFCYGYLEMHGVRCPSDFV